MHLIRTEAKIDFLRQTGGRGEGLAVLSHQLPGTIDLGSPRIYQLASLEPRAYIYALSCDLWKAGVTLERIGRGPNWLAIAKGRPQYPAGKHVAFAVRPVIPRTSPWIWAVLECRSPRRAQYRPCVPAFPKELLVCLQPLSRRILIKWLWRTSTLLLVCWISTTICAR